MAAASKQLRAPILAAALLPLCLMLPACAGERAVVDATPYVSVHFVGENGSGTAELKLDETGLTKAALAAMGLDESDLPAPDTREAAQAQQLLDSLSLQVTPAEGLSNGDTVLVEGTVDSSPWERFLGGRLSVTVTSFTAVVSGLQEVASVDPFQNVLVGWSGYAPEIALQLTLQDTRSAPWSWISYATSAAGGLDVGDTVTVTAAADPETLLQLGYRLTATEKQYTVPAGLGRYLADWGDVSAEGASDLLQAVQAGLDALPGSLAPEAILLEDGSVQPLGLCADAAFDHAVFLSAGSRPAAGPGWRNALVCVYCFNTTGQESEPAAAYGAFALPDLAVTAAGELVQTAAVYAYPTAALSLEALALDPCGNAYRITDAGFDRPQTPESAS